MARRASSRIHPLWLGIIILILIAAIGGGYFLFNRQPIAEVDELLGRWRR